MTQEEQVRKQAIKEAARRLFCQFGYQKTSLEDIAREAGIAKPTLYYYYPNKEALFDEIVYEDAREIFRKVGQQLDPDLPADEKFRQFGRMVLEELKAHAAEIAHIPENFIEFNPHGRPIVEKIRKLFREKMKNILQEGIEQGVFDIPDLELTVDTLEAMGDFIRMPWLIRNEPEYCTRIFEEYQRIVLRGLKK